MSTDGSVLTINTPTAYATAPTLADVLRHLEGDAGLDPHRCREMCSAVRTIGRVLGKDLGSVPAQPRQLRRLLANVTAAAAGVSAGRWSNIRSLTFKALKRAGIKAMPGRYREPLAPEWEVLRARLPDRRFQSGLSRFMSYCTARGISPDSVIAEIFVEFGAELEAHSMVRDPGGLSRDTCKLWNQAAATIAGWPQLQVEVPVRRMVFALPLEEFPATFGEDVERFLSQTADPDVFSDGYCKPARPLTVRNRRHHDVLAATALVRSGFPVAQITGLDVLVNFDNARAALRFLYGRAGGETSGHIYQIAMLLKTIARHYVKLSEDAVEPLRKLCKALKPKNAGLTEKNKRFLRQFVDLRKLVALLTLPERVIAAAERQRSDRRRDAVKVELSIAVAIELVIPIRADNLAGLRLDRHLQFAGDRAYLGIPVEETKNDNAIEAELPSSLARKLRIYIEKYRPLLIASPAPWLFPGEAGARRPSGGFSSQIQAFIAKEAGVAMTTHQFRHLAAKLYLDRHPDGFETVRRLLGHKSIETTMRFYRELELGLATKRYGEFLERLLADAETRIPLKPRCRRRHEHGG
jgi:integrase